MHVLLRRQLRRHLGLEDGAPVRPDLARFIEAVDAAYHEADNDRAMMEHSLGLATVELQERYQQLQHETTLARERTEQTLQSQKLQAVGQLASGVAHEINTPIQYVGDNADFLRHAFDAIASVLAQVEHLSDASPVRATAAKVDLKWLLEEVPRALDGTREGIRRVSELVRALKEFAHPDSDEMTPVDLNAALENAVTVARNEHKYVADVVTDFAALPPVHCHAGSLNQVFLNLIVNAAHAIADARKPGRGRITLTTRLEDRHVVVAITDTGGGIPDKIKHRIFEPFFTTKPVGKGTGQGLALAQSIVQKHQGRVTFESIAGAGTTFFVRLPVAGALQRVA